MPDVNLVLSIPQGIITATSLGIEGFARHMSPGSGKHFRGRKLFVDLAVRDGRPDYSYLEEGGWRNSARDTESALKAAASGNRTKTALSNNAFSCTPIDAYRDIFLVKTGGEVLRMDRGMRLHEFRTSECHEEMSPSEVASAAGSPDQIVRTPRIYLVMCPIELLLVSNLTPVEYAWYATHRPGKIFRQVIFAELSSEQHGLAARSQFANARFELESQPSKKTKTVVSDDCINEVPFHSWLGYGRRTEGGLYASDSAHMMLWPFPGEVPASWENALG